MEEMVNLRGKVAIVTGAGRGIGQGIAQLLAEQGAYVAVAEVADWGMQTVKLIRAAGGEAFWQRTDVGDETSTQELVDAVLERYERIDILVNNAAIQTVCPLWELSAEQFDGMVRTNLRGTYLCARFVIPEMIRQGGGYIVNIASNLATRALSGFSGYSATKGAIVALSRTLALECAPHNIRVNCICPGSTITPIMDPLLAEMDDADAVLAEAAKRMPAGRLGLPDDIAYLVLYLVSDRAQMVVGATYVIDGGASIGLATS